MIHLNNQVCSQTDVLGNWILVFTPSLWIWMLSKSTLQDAAIISCSSWQGKEMFFSCLYSRYSLRRVKKFILPIFLAQGRGVYSTDIPWAGSRSLYSRYSLRRVEEFMLPIFPVQGRGVCFLVNRETFVGTQKRIKVVYPSCHHHWLFWDLNPGLTARVWCILTTKPRLLPGQRNEITSPKWYACALRYSFHSQTIISLCSLTSLPWKATNPPIVGFSLTTILPLSVYSLWSIISG